MPAPRQLWTFHIGQGAQPFLDENRIRTRSGYRVQHQAFTDAVYPCKDGYVCIDTPQNRQWKKFVEVMGNPEWAKDPMFNERIKIVDENPEKAEAFLTPWLMSHGKEEIYHLCQDNGVPAAPVRNVQDAANNEHLKVRGYFVEIDHPAAGKLKYPGVGYKFTESPFTVRRAAPLLGEHNEEIFSKKLGYSKTALASLKKEKVI
jgi:crotonobetainyl-CoA:carnitine CoA-transferase CaiB-like acyl-CoA transferase